MYCRLRNEGGYTQIFVQNIEDPLLLCIKCESLKGWFIQNFKFINVVSHLAKKPKHDDHLSFLSSSVSAAVVP